ncbi:hypothetical protein BU23DRAFT_552323 [Bimuria novae-zelandiae CBS 107.79]|uniref:Uncharacterized protein n=1 Tax=Bimuria novae-zelandiae CBS 107.79 TaxID=1447943 RepID=A0A6A5VFC2_9PLEO|nr:hypothetical protein BU23DRAFT_552323 [Bimuria novae-zelandiae CBS 107.79]
MAILNLDETLVPYESGWQNWQAIVVLIVLVDRQPLQAIVIFHRVPGGRIHTHERESWRGINVQVYINAKA